MAKSIRIAFIFSFLLATPPAAPAAWNSPSDWTAVTDGRSKISLTEVPGKSSKALKIDYALVQDGWVLISKELDHFPEDRPLVFWIKSDSPSYLEIKAVDRDGSNFLKKIPLKDKYAQWTRIAASRNSLEYGWGGDDQLGEAKEICFAVSGSGSGTVWLDDIGWGRPGERSTFPPAGPLLDPDRNLPGIGFRQRRERQMSMEDPFVLQWIKANQDTSSPEKKLLSSMEDNITQTFNNALGAMVFILKNERERAERILDFYAAALQKNNQDPALQNFYYKGEARGFYQNIWLSGPQAYHSLPNGDRWVGDMAWLLIAYKYYDRQFDRLKYGEIEKTLNDFLKSIVRKGESSSYVPSGWWAGDKEFRTVGYGEPNIDCMIAFQLMGDEALAKDVRVWLDSILKGNRLPLDNYSWRVLAYGKDAEKVLDIPEHDLRFRKTLNIKGNTVMGFFHGPEDVDNIWLDSLGHMACAYFTVGNFERGNFYANQYDAFKIDRMIDGNLTRAFPYTANRMGGYEWVDPARPHISVACWYIFAKNRFNPFHLKSY